jgi:putative phage-type endonuclease
MTLMAKDTINNIFDDTKKYLESQQKKSWSETEYYTLLNKCYRTYKETYPELTLILMNEVFTILIKNKKEFIETLVTDKCYFPNHLELYSQVKIPKEFKKLEEHFQKLKALPQPEQRSKEWFEYRHNRITASDTAAAIDENPYEPVESFILKKCDPDHQFLDNANVYHGKKFELIATKIYEHIYNVQVVEFGALPSETQPLLGASPDGICSAKTLDNKFSDKLGTMLEIKCVAPNGRTIETSGRIPGHICPYYYYLQVQQQLECCELQTCDFWQCKLIEYKTREDYLIDNCQNTKHQIGINAQSINIDDRIKKGVLLQFFPKIWEPQFEEDNIEWKSKFIYPPRLDMNSQQYDEWIAKTMSELNKKYPDIIKDYSFNKIIYWKLEQSHNQPIERDQKLFASILPILKQTWEKVKYYREHLDELPKLKQIIEKRKKYIRTDTEFKIDNDLINNKVLFLDDFKQSITKKEVVSKNLKNHVECNFVDDDELDKLTKQLNKSKSQIKKIKTPIKKEESDKEDDEYIKLPKINFLNKTQFKKDDSECDFID